MKKNVSAAQVGEGDAKLPGVLTLEEGTEKNREDIRVNRVVARSLIELQIDTIRHFEGIPDFVVPTHSDNPIVISAQGRFFCIEGWEIVETSRSEGDTTILCEVDEMDFHSDIELCLRKCGMRSLTRGGNYIYAEMVRNTKDMLSMLLSSSDDLRIYGHGGKRYGEGFNENREEDVRHILSLRLGKNRDTINAYLNYGEYLTPEILEYFIERRAPKSFFEKTQNRKRMEIRKLKVPENSLMIMTEAISQFMLEEWDRWQKLPSEGENNKRDNTGSNEKETPSSTDRTTSEEVDDINEDSEDNYPTQDEESSSSTPENENTESVTVDSIKRGVMEVAQRISDIRQEQSLAEMKNRLENELRVIMEILNRINSLHVKELTNNGDLH